MCGSRGEGCHPGGGFDCDCWCDPCCMLCCFPAGPKTLCNACGVRALRSQQRANKAKAAAAAGAAGGKPLAAQSGQQGSSPPSSGGGRGRVGWGWPLCCDVVDRGYAKVDFNDDKGIKRSHHRDRRSRVICWSATRSAGSSDSDTHSCKVSCPVDADLGCRVRVRLWTRGPTPQGAHLRRAGGLYDRCVQPVGCFRGCRTSQINSRWQPLGGMHLCGVGLSAPLSRHVCLEHGRSVACVNIACVQSLR